MAESVTPPSDEKREDFHEFYLLSEKATGKDSIDSNIREYHLNKSSYSSEMTPLSMHQIETLIKLRNNGISPLAIANKLKVKQHLIAKAIKQVGFTWSISLKRYVNKESLPKRVKKESREKSRIYDLQLEPETYRLLALRSYLDNASFSQVLTAALKEFCSKELIQLSIKPEKALRLSKLKKFI